MRFKNIIHKDILRYVKDNGQYNIFKRQLKKFLKCDDETTLITKIKQLGNVPQQLLKIIGIEDGEWYYSPYEIDYYLRHKEETIKLFENFINDKNIKELFFENVDEKFIQQVLPNTVANKIPNTTKQNLLYDNVPPRGYIIYAFRWETSKAPKNTKYEYISDFWGNINIEWEITYKKYIINKYYK